MNGLPPPPPPPPDWTGGAGVAGVPVRWATGDAAWAFAVGTLVSIVASVFVIDATKPVQLVTLIVSQDVGIIGYLAAVARWRGVGSLAADFGLHLTRAGRSAVDLLFLPFGVVLQIGLLIPTAVLEAAYGHTARQAVVNDASKARGGLVVAMVLGIAVLAPLTEELLFRGALLRALLRRTSPERAVFLSAGVFGLVHVVGDPSVGSLIALPAIVTLGVISGDQAVRTGSLTRSILLHIGFNALSVLFIFMELD